MPLPPGVDTEALFARYLPAESWERPMRPRTEGHRLVAAYAGLSIPEVDALSFPVFLLLRRDAWLDALRQTETGREALRAFWRLGRTECEAKGGVTFGRV